MKTTVICALALYLLSLGPASAGILYSNGPLNGTVHAWANDHLAVSDSFTVFQAATVTSFDFGEWTNLGQTVPLVDWAIGTAPGASDIGSGTGAAVTNVYDFTDSLSGDFLYAISTDTVTGLSVALPSGGTYWLTLSHALSTDSSSGGPGFWDENDGPSAAFQGVQSLANGGSLGFCPSGAAACTGSETFDIYGDNGTAVPEPGGMALMGCAFLALMAALRRRRARLRASVARLLHTTICGWDVLPPRQSTPMPPVERDRHLHFQGVLTTY